MAQTISYERTGLDTGTGNRSAARIAGGGMPDSPLERRSGIPQQTFQEMFQGLVDKQSEKERVAAAAQKARDNYESGTPAPLNSPGTQAIIDVNAAKTLSNTTNNLKIANQGYADRGDIDLANERAKKASGLGQYNGTGGGVVTDVTNKGAQWMLGMAADDKARQTYEMSQKAANATQSQIDANRAVGLDNAYTQRYAAAQSAQAQKDSAAMAMFGQLAGQGNYKYWGG